MRGFFGSVNTPSVPNFEPVTVDVTFSEPLQDNHYVVVVMQEACGVSVSARSTTGFSLVTCGGGSIDWAVLVPTP